MSTVIAMSLFGLINAAQSSSFSEITASFENQLQQQPTSTVNTDKSRFQVVLPTTNQTITLVAKYKQKFEQYELWGGVVKELKNSGFSIELRDGTYTGELQLTDSNQHFTISTGADQNLVLIEEDPSKGFCIQQNQNEAKPQISQEPD